MIDSHCHIDFRDFNDNRDQIIASAHRAGVHTLINIGADLKTSENSVALSKKHESIFATVGVHPHDAKTLDDRVYGRLKQLAARPKTVGIGEIGLDFYRDLSPRAVQRQAFRRQLELAVELRLPIVIHTREATEDTIEIVKEHASDLVGGVFHCFPDSPDEAYRVIALGFVVGIGGVVTYKKSKMALVASEIPLDKIILETDAPYLAPVPFRGKTNQPAYVKIVCEKIAELRGIDSSEVEKVTDRTCQKLFKLVETFGE